MKVPSRLYKLHCAVGRSGRTMHVYKPFGIIICLSWYMSQRTGCGIGHTSQECVLWKQVDWEGHVEWQDWKVRVMMVFMKDRRICANGMGYEVVWLYWETRIKSLDKICVRQINYHFRKRRPWRRGNDRLNEYMCEGGASRSRSPSAVAHPERAKH